MKKSLYGLKAQYRNSGYRNQTINNEKFYGFEQMFDENNERIELKWYLPGYPEREVKETAREFHTWSNFLGKTGFLEHCHDVRSYSNGAVMRYRTNKVKFLQVKTAAEYFSYAG